MTADDDDHGQAPEAPWHHSTPAVFGASLAALAVIALAVWGVVALTSPSPEDAPINFVDPTYASTTASTTSSTTPTITTTRTPITTEFDLPSDTSGTSPSESTDASESAETPTTWTSHELPTTRRPHSSEDEDGSSTSRNRPRTNVTRTLYPGN